MKDIRIGIVGLGKRGMSLLEQIILPQGECVVAVCDSYPDRANQAATAIIASGQAKPEIYTNYHALIEDNNVNTVLITSSWESHISISIEAMRAGKAVALEVGGAYTVEECWDLVRTQEETAAPFMYMENCCFGRREMMVLNMAQQGVLGEIVHCSGGYHHDLREEIAFGQENRHYRLRNYISRNCENYPSHELGPIARVLDINHGNRMLSVSSVSSKSVGLHDYILRNKPSDHRLSTQQFAQGDIVTSIIRCARGETIVLTLDTTLPRYYSRGFTVRGTRGMYEEATDSIFLDTPEDRDHDFNWRKTQINNAEHYQEQFDHPLWKSYSSLGIRGTHDGMDWLEFQQFFDSLRNNAAMPIDVYDAASWMCISALSEASISCGGLPMSIPDFTKGSWYLKT